MQAFGREAIDTGELPAGKDRLHDLEAVRHPFDRIEQRLLVRRRPTSFARSNTISGSMRGSIESANEAPVDAERSCTVVSYMLPQIGAVDPVLRPRWRDW